MLTDHRGFSPTTIDLSVETKSITNQLKLDTPEESTWTLKSIPESHNDDVKTIRLYAILIINTIARFDVSHCANGIENEQEMIFEV